MKRTLTVRMGLLCLFFAAHSAFAIQTQEVDLGRAGVYDGLVKIERDGAGRLTLRDAEVTSPVTLNDLRYSNTAHWLLQGLDRDDHPQYHNDARALTWLGTRSTSDLAEGANFYFTAARARAALGAAAPLQFDPATGTFGLDPATTAVLTGLTLTGLPAGAIPYAGAGGGLAGDAGRLSFSSGGVGIGTTAPLSRLDVIRDTEGTFSGATMSALCGDPAAGQSDSWFSIGNSINGAYGHDSDSTGLWLNYRGYEGGTTRYRDLSIGNGKGTAVMSVDGSAAAVGIGTNAPNVTLDVRIPGSMYSTNGVIANLGVGSGTDRRIEFYRYFTSNPWIETMAISAVYGTGGYNNLSLNPTGGNVGIGTNIPTAKLDLNGSGRVRGTLTLDGETTAAALNVTGRLRLSAAAAQTLTTDTQAIACATALVVLDATGNRLLSATPTIAAGVEGQLLTVVNQNAAYYVRLYDADSAAGTNLALASSSRTLYRRDVLTLLYTGGMWCEVSYAQNH